VCWRTRDDDGLPFVVAIDRGEGERRAFVYKACAALTLNEVHKYFLALGRYEERAADIADALAWRMQDQGIVPQGNPRRLMSVQQFWMQKKAEGWAAAEGLSDEDVMQALEKYAHRWEEGADF
jgi:hypothetical protein